MDEIVKTTVSLVAPDTCDPESTTLLTANSGGFTGDFAIDLRLAFNSDALCSVRFWKTANHSVKNFGGPTDIGEERTTKYI